MATFCAGCGSSLSADDKFCRVCGRTVLADSVLMPANIAPPVGPAGTSGKAIASLVFGLLFLFPAVCDCGGNLRTFLPFGDSQKCWPAHGKWHSHSRPGSRLRRVVRYSGPDHRGHCNTESIARAGGGQRVVSSSGGADVEHRGNQLLSIPSSGGIHLCAVGSRDR